MLLQTTSENSEFPIANESFSPDEFLIISDFDETNKQKNFSELLFASASIFPPKKEEKLLRESHLFFSAHKMCFF
jgi:hypothetical protein